MRLLLKRLFSDLATCLTEFGGTANAANQAEVMSVQTVMACGSGCLVLLELSC